MSEESNDSLRADRDHLARALSERSTQLETVTKEFDQFTQVLSHDLRAPLRALEGFAQILMEDYADKLDPDGKRCVETLATSAHKASALIEDLHGFSRLSQKPCNHVAMDIQKLASQKADELKAEGAAAQFRIDELPEAWGDRELLDAVVEELLRNAVKFSRRQPNPAIEVTGRTEDQRTIYSVRDNGIGFEPKYAGRLFGVFQRLQNEKDFEGHGIGLATVQRLVHRHGGTVWAEGKPGVGATFSFALPTRPL